MADNEDGFECQFCDRVLKSKGGRTRHEASCDEAEADENLLEQLRESHKNVIDVGAERVQFDCNSCGEHINVLRDELICPVCEAEAL